MFYICRYCVFAWWGKTLCILFVWEMWNITQKIQFCYIKKNVAPTVLTPWVLLAYLSSNIVKCSFVEAHYVISWWYCCIWNFNMRQFLYTLYDWFVKWYDNQEFKFITQFKKKCRWFKVLYATLTVVIHTVSEHCMGTRLGSHRLLLLEPAGSPIKFWNLRRGNIVTQTWLDSCMYNLVQTEFSDSHWILILDNLFDQSTDTSNRNNWVDVCWLGLDFLNPLRTTCRLVKRNIISFSKPIREGVRKNSLIYKLVMLHCQSFMIIGLTSDHFMIWTNQMLC